MLEVNKIYQGNCLDVLKSMEDESIQCCVTSPPYYGLRDYGETEQMGLENTPEEYVSKIVDVFKEVKRVMSEDGTLWLNLGDSYAANRGYQVDGNISGKETNKAQSVGGRGMKAANYGLKPKDLIGIPWMVAFALRADGWYLRQDIIWHKPNPMPESVTDRCTKSHEYIFLLSKSSKYYFDQEAIKQESLTFDNGTRDRDRTRLNNTPGRTKMNGLTTNQYDLANKRSVWTVTTMPYSEAHFATFPERLIVDCVKAGCPLFVCNQCGKPREPIFDVKPMVIDRSNRREEMGQPNGIASSGTVVSNREATFTGYSNCGCNAEFSPGIVLDPFIGAGTTGLVARKLNRNFIGIELNEKYIQIANKRLKKELGLFL